MCVPAIVEERAGAQPVVARLRREYLVGEATPRPAVPAATAVRNVEAPRPLMPLM